MKKKDNWLNYYKKVNDRPVHPILKIALQHIKHGRLAYDLGAGSGVDSRFLARKGWEVVAVDKEKSAIEFIQNSILGERVNLTAVCGSFEKIKLAESDLIFSSASLPFCNPKKFEKVWKKINASLKIGGIFAGTLFGEKDSWAKEYRKKMTFLSSQQLYRLLEGYDVLFYDQFEQDRPSALGPLKHWHFHSFVFKKL